MQLAVEVEGEGAQGTLPGGGADLVVFMSFAVMRGFGAEHPLIALAERLQRQHRVRLGPLTTFYDATAEDAEDVAKLELAWQEAGPLGESLGALLAALASDPAARALAGEAGSAGLEEQARALLAMACRAAAAGKRVRLSYRL
jgi:hypothetical protein